MIDSTFVLEAIIPIVIGFSAYYLKSLDAAGSLVGTAIGLVILARGFEWFIVFLTFFVLGMIATNYRVSEKLKYGLGQKRRETENVLGNGLAALIFALTGNVYGFFGAVAAATSDTISSEIGILSKKSPVSILNFKTKVKRGSNGGVTNLGNLFMFLGSGLIGILGLLLFNNFLLFWVGFWSGIFGCIVDSILGATLENKKIIGNSTVNFLSTLIGGSFAFLLSILFQLP
ncbi:MAG: DUF92 domain-containing protein [Candidatus Diapherotrites archaeon]|nr:DUF92 domain-containing protein [Candidatus Diapherotrites archaeon]